MKLFYSAASPFVRKVVITAMLGGVESRIERVGTDPWSSPPALLARNPLSKVPCLVTEDGVALFDSPVICEYLDSIGDCDLFPKPGPARWRALTLQAVADGIVDAGILRRQDEARPQDPARTVAIARQTAAVTRGLDLLEQLPPADHMDIGAVSVVCALGWLLFRYGQEDWRVTRPRLAEWHHSMMQRPEVAETVPR